MAILLIKAKDTLTISFCGFLKNLHNRDSVKNQNSLFCILDPFSLTDEGHLLKLKFLAKDKQGQQVFLADSAFSLQMTIDKYPTLQFHSTSEY